MCLIALSAFRVASHMYARWQVGRIHLVIKAVCGNYLKIFLHLLKFVFIIIRSVKVIYFSVMEKIGCFKIKCLVLPSRVWQPSTTFSSWWCKNLTNTWKNLATCPQPEINHFTSAGSLSEVLMIAGSLRTFFFFFF